MNLKTSVCIRESIVGVLEAIQNTPWDAQGSGLNLELEIVMEL